MTFNSGIRIALALFIAVYWLWAASVGWERYMSANPRWIRKRWLAAVLGGTALVVGLNWILLELGIDVLTLSQ